MCLKIYRTLVFVLIFPYARSGIFSWLIDSYYNWKNPMCEVDFRDAVRRIEMGLKNELFGQDMVSGYMGLALSGHLKQESPQHALSIVFLGSTGTGKNLVAKIIGDAIHPEHQKYVKTFSGRLDFPSPSKVEQYQERLIREIEESVKKCPQAVFIFDEIDKVPAGVIDTIKPYLDYHTVVNHNDYRKAIFIFLTNWGGSEINSIYVKLRDQGLARESMSYTHFEKTLRRALYDHANGMFHKSSMIEDFVISFYLPFLPLDKSHVAKCIVQEMRRRNLKPTDTNVERVMNQMEFFDGHLSLSGCKRVADLVSIESYRNEEL